MSFATIVADPPWQYRSSGVHLRDRSGGRNADGRGANVSSQQRYGSLSVGEIAALRPPAAANAHLYLWTTNAFMVEAHEIACAWGFEPKTILTWVKTRTDGGVSRKSGYYFRGATEHVVFAVRGSRRLAVPEAIPTAFLWRRLPHSVKPDEFYELVDRVSPGPTLELFARRRWRDWSVWGNELENDVEIEMAA